MLKKLILTAIISILSISYALGQVPELMSYQGILKDSNGEIVPNGEYELTFGIYTNFLGGSPFWEETQTVEIKDGVFQVLLGSETPIETLPLNNSWLSVRVEDNNEMLPRKRFSSAGYAFHAKDALKLSGFEASDFLLKDDFSQPFVISTQETSFSISQPNTWYQAKTLSITIEYPTQLKVYAHYFGGSFETLADNNFIQITLNGSQGQTIDLGEKSFRIGGLVPNIDTQITFDVDPGNYTLVLNARATTSKVIEDMYFEVLGVPSGDYNRSQNFTIDSPGTISDIPTRANNK